MRSVLSGALKIADKVTVAQEAVGNKIRLNSQGWEDARIIGERQVLMVVAYNLALSPAPASRVTKRVTGHRLASSCCIPACVTLLHRTSRVTTSAVVAQHGALALGGKVVRSGSANSGRPQGARLPQAVGK